MVDTGVEIEVLQQVAQGLSSFPEDLHVHKNLQKIIKQRGAMTAAGKDFDWAMGEGMAFGSLLLEGNMVRLSGQVNQMSLEAVDACAGLVSALHNTLCGRFS